MCVCYWWKTKRPQRLTHFNIYSPVGGAIREGCGTFGTGNLALLLTVDVSSHGCHGKLLLLALCSLSHELG